MADTVRYLMEEMIPELEDLEERGYFTRAEIKQIVKRRTDFEYLLKRRAAVKADYLKCGHHLLQGRQCSDACVFNNCSAVQTVLCLLAIWACLTLLLIAVHLQRRPRELAQVSNRPAAQPGAQATWLKQALSGRLTQSPTCEA